MKKKKVNKLLMILTFFLLLNSCTLLKSFLYHPYELYVYESTDTEKNGQTVETVIMFHGIYGTHKDMSAIGKRLSMNNYNVVSIQYPSTEDNIEEIVEKYIKPNVENVILNTEKINEQFKESGIDRKNKIHFVAHSMGTGILRYYLKENHLENLGKTVFISPPSHGSQLSDNFIAKGLKGTLGKVVEQFETSPNSFINSLEEPNYDCYVLMGNKSGNWIYSRLIPGKDDGMVPVKTARLNNCSYKLFKKETHMSILKDEEVINEIIKYLKDE